MRTIGLIGGMSWESTAEYYRLEVWQRVAVAVVYIGLIGVLALAVSATHVERDF